MKRGQITAEFIFAAGIIMVLFLILVTLVVEKQSEIHFTKDLLEKRSECLRFANLLSSVYAAGPGTTLNTKTNYLITIYNDSSIGVRDIENSTELRTRVAVTVGEAGETTQVFYDRVNDALEPVWYKACFSDIDSSGCQSSGANVNYSLIPYNISQLICTDLNNYNIVYIEDSHFAWNANCSGQNYTQVLEDWVSLGNTLITAEHLMCREQTSGSYTSTSYRCNPPGSNGDRWHVFGKDLYQLSGVYGNIATVGSIPDPAFFPNLANGESYDFEEPSYVRLNNTRAESEGFTFVDGFTSSTTCICNSASDRCASHTGSVSNIANATWTVNVTGQFEVRMRYCGENDGNDNWTVYHNNIQLTNWTTSSAQPSWTYRSLGTLTLSSGDTIRLSCKRGTSNSNCRTDFLDLIPADGSTTVARYDANAQPAILYWNYGSGRIFYFGDFQVGGGEQTAFSDIIAELIELVNEIYYTPGYKETFCTHTGVLEVGKEVTNRIRIQNVDGAVRISSI